MSPQGCPPKAQSFTPGGLLREVPQSSPLQIASGWWKVSESSVNQKQRAWTDSADLNFGSQVSSEQGGDSC